MNFLEAGSFEELFKINLHQYNIGFMDLRDFEPQGLRQYLTENFNRLMPFYKMQIEKVDFEKDLLLIDKHFSHLPHSDEKFELIQFVKFLVSNYADVTDAPILGLSIEIVKNDLCSLFHCDMNSLRLVYPLLGPGTLWVKDEDVNRNYLGLRRNDLVVNDSSKINQVPLKTLAVLKGNGFYAGANRGVVHASPKISTTQEKRILLRIESLY